MISTMHDLLALVACARVYSPGTHPAHDMTAHAARYGPCEATALQERMKRAVALLGEAEVKAILEKEGRIEVRASAPASTAWPDLVAALAPCSRGSASDDELLSEPSHTKQCLNGWTACR